MKNDYYTLYPKDKVVESFLNVINVVEDIVDCVNEEVYSSSTLFLIKKRMLIIFLLKSMPLEWKISKIKIMLPRMSELSQA